LLSFSSCVTYSRWGEPEYPSLLSSFSSCVTYSWWVCHNVYCYRHHFPPVSHTQGEDGQNIHHYCHHFPFVSQTQGEDGRIFIAIVTIFLLCCILKVRMLEF
jgi:hypothetical protein